MKIYTKTGDTGYTALLGGNRVLKSHSRIEAYGTMDELNSYIGLLRNYQPFFNYDPILDRIQNNLFVMGSILACDVEPGNLKLPVLEKEEIDALEKEIDRIDSIIPPLKNFILPGGHEAVSFCHIARCVCRRAERYTVGIAGGIEVPGNIIIYLNRLSDFLFMLARKISFDLGLSETPWKPRG